MVSFLTLEEEVGSDKHRNKLGRFLCDCGKTTVVPMYKVRNGSTKSCGCYLIRRIKETKTTHGLSGTRVYNIWKGILKRCYNSKADMYYRYGARGISVSKEWKSDPEAFVSWALSNGYAADLMLDREDNNGDYTASNCRWVSSRVNILNRGVQGNNKSGFVGVGWIARLGKWQANVGFTDGGKKQQKYLGVFSDIKEAVVARNSYILEHRLPNLLQDPNTGDLNDSKNIPKLCKEV